MQFSNLLRFSTLAAISTLLIFNMACQNSAEQKPAVSSTPAAPAATAPNTPSLAPATFRGLEVKPVNFSGRIYMSIRQRVAFAKIQPFYANNLGKIFTACQANGLLMDGMPSGLFYQYDEDAGETDMAAAIGVKTSKELGDGIQTVIIPAGKTALQIDYYGPYKGVAEAHYAMDEYIKSNRLVQNKTLPVIEEYVTDPSTEPDPNKRLTRLIYFYGN